ncbi:MAG: isoaspartyl peptidase/L-asparaginase [Blastocatellia bacterium]|nr:isoaspartyl peptidase/L-asparaginase [Blastocatellia bacterium]
MRRSLCLVFCLCLLWVGSTAHAHRNQPQSRRIGMVIHGGAGTILKSSLTPEMEKAYRDKLTESLLAGKSVLENHGSSLDAVEAAIRILEDSPLFNAGKGAVFTADGTNSLDASVMEGKSLKAGAVAGVGHIKNPISLARIVMEKSPHVLLTGKGAETFAQLNGVKLVNPKYFFTERRWEELQHEKELEKKGLKENMRAAGFSSPEDRKYGTVGAVALDETGSLAAGTSTGGMTNKKWGRIGDSPIIGAGTYANNQTCAVSATGHGEYFIRLGVARDIAALMEYQKLSVKEATETVILKKLEALGGKGGVIAIDRNGNIAMTFNSEGMYRAYLNPEGQPVVEIFR